MGFFKNVGVSYEYLYDLMHFGPVPGDINLFESDLGDVVEEAIIKEKTGFCIRIKRKKQKRASILRFSYTDIIRVIENETPNLKNKKISEIVFPSSFIRHTAGYSGKSILMLINFGDTLASRVNGFSTSIFSPIYQHSHVYHMYTLGHKFLDLIS